ncbi:MAG: DUF4388 domain-containing protein [Polyangiales bacterium]
MSAERRKAPRIRASLKVHFVGIERRGRMRCGDLSVTGIRIDDPDASLGHVGSIARLRLSSRDDAFKTEIDACLVRVERIEDLKGTRMRMVGFDFMPTDELQREAIAMLFVHIASGQIRRDGSTIRRRSQPPAADDVPSEVHSCSIETEWQLRKGEEVRIELPAPEGGSTTFAGKAVRSRLGKKGTYRTSVEFIPKDDEASVVPAGAEVESPDDHMVGDLAHIRAPSLLSLASLEGMSGILRLHRDERNILVYLSNGDIVDADEPGTQTSRRQLIAQICQWETGHFELSLGPVTRPNSIGVPTPALLLQLAQLQDEHRRVA